MIIGKVTPFDPTDSVRAAAETLNSAGIPYALIGGVALDAWSIPRATKDVDFAVPCGVAEKVAEQLRSPSTSIRPLRIGGTAVRDEQRNLKIDLIDRRFHFARLFSDAIAEAGTSRRFARIGDLDVPVVSLEHLLTMKMVSGEPKDDADVRRILRLDRLDYTLARALVEQHLGPATANRLDQFGREEGRPEPTRKELYKSGGDSFGES